MNHFNVYIEICNVNYFVIFIVGHCYDKISNNTNKMNSIITMYNEDLTVGGSTIYVKINLH